ncbi:MAG: hypothetical protein H0T96_08175 [Thermoleophilaceae bacterium]|nr:hypothetical protein [Thermoleophilaceae bacterium]
MRLIQRKFEAGEHSLNIPTRRLAPGRYNVIVFAEADGRFTEELSLRLIVRRR